jgi:hypothetical protein
MALDRNIVSLDSYRAQLRIARPILQRAQAFLCETVTVNQNLGANEAMGELRAKGRVGAGKLPTSSKFTPQLFIAFQRLRLK